MGYDGNKNYLEDERDELNQVLKELDELYIETKEVLDNHLNQKVSTGNSINSQYSKPKITYVFVSSQTANLISIKNQKLATIKEKIRLSTEIENYKLKLENKSNGENNDLEIMKQLLMNISTNNSSVINNNEIKIDPNMFNNDDELDRLIEAKLNEEDDYEIIEEEIEKVNPIINFIEAINQNGLNILVDNSNLLPLVCDENYIVYDEYKDNLSILEIKRDDSQEFAIDQYGNEYELIEFEEE